MAAAASALHESGCGAGNAITGAVAVNFAVLGQHPSTRREFVCTINVWDLKVIQFLLPWPENTKSNPFARFRSNSAVGSARYLEGKAQNQWGYPVYSSYKFGTL
jgi:hypothetical protein